MSTFEEEDFMSFDIIPSFSPEEISRSTFTRLLKCYPTTIREVYRDKLLDKYEGVRRKAKKGEKDAAPVVVPEKQVEKDLNALLKLDEWRYEILPGKVRERREEGKEEAVFIEKEELVQLMEWKLKHGIFRPTLLGLVRSNQAPLVRKTTSAAFAALPSAGDDAAKDSAATFPKASLDTLTEPLRGVGPATASLILCAGTCPSGSEIQVPFFSDEIYQWLCLDCYPSAEEKGEGTRVHENDDDDDDDDDEPRKQPPKKKNGELIIKYNMAEYRNVWDAVSGLLERLNRTAKPDSAVEDEKRIFSVVDVEKVAFVLGNIELSGYFGEPKTREERIAARATTEPKAAQKRKAELSKEEKFRAKKRRIKAKHERREAKKKRRTGRNN
ncbi:hypothetical protein Plec18170_003857 [Paecilomyces lecythidis]